MIANLIACSPDTPRIVADVPIFEIQEKVIARVLHGQQEQLGLIRAPKLIDPFQQTVATTLQGLISHPSVDRQAVMEALKYLRTPLSKSQLDELRKAYEGFQSYGDPKVLLDAVLGMRDRYGGEGAGDRTQQTAASMKREDLRLICFDVVSS